jgi:hypothetical protein
MAEKTITRHILAVNTRGATQLTLSTQRSDTRIRTLAVDQSDHLCLETGIGRWIARICRR